MNTRWKHGLRSCARASAWVAGILVIVLAVVVGLAQLLLPLVAGHPEWVAGQLSTRLHRPTSFDSMRGQWTASGPLLALQGVRVGAPAGRVAGGLHIPEVDLRLDFSAWVVPGRHLFNVHVRGLRATATRTRDGKWQVMGAGVELGGPALDLGHLSADLWLDNLQLAVDDQRLGQRFDLSAPHLRVNRTARGRVRLAGIVQRQHSAGSLRVAGDFQQGRGTGRLWVGLDASDLRHMLSGVEIGGYRLDDGRGRVGAWLRWRQGQLADALVQLDLAGLVVSSAAAQHVQAGPLRGLAGLRRVGDGYRLSWAGSDGSTAAALVRDPGTPQLAVGIAARDWQLAPWLSLLALKPGLAPGLVQWLGHGQPRALANRLDLGWSRAHGLQALDLEFSGVGIDPAGKLPGVDRLAGHLVGDAEALSLRLPAQAVTVSLPDLFRQPLELSRLDGSLALWQDDAGWVLGVDALDVSAEDYAAQLRGQLAFPQAGGAPSADLFATVDQAKVPAAKLFWPSSMPPATMAWLDRALVAGRVEGAKVVLRGNLADWPFTHHEGRFEAHVPIHDLTLDYAPGWPRAERAEAVADFVGSGFRAVASTAQTLGVHATLAAADIADFANAPLELSIRGGGSGDDLMRFVRESPIGSGQRDTLDKLSLGGTGTFAMHLELPLHTDDAPRLSGAVELSDADVRAPDWNLELEQLGGPLHFDLQGIEADRLQAGFHGRASTLALAIGEVHSHPDTSVWVQMRGDYSLADLVRDYPSLAWIGQGSTGSGDFRVAFSAVPAAGAAPARQQLTIDSDLRGVALNYPAPLQKEAPAAMPLHVVVGVPVDGADLRVALGQVARGRFRLAGDAPPVAGVIAFGTEMPQHLPPTGLQIRGHAQRLDVTGWVQQTASSEGSGGLAVSEVQVSTDHALWFNRSLGSMRIDATSPGAALEVQVDGPSMAGTISIPTTQLQQKGVTARVQRLYWPVDATPDTTAGDAAGTAPAPPAAAKPPPGPEPNPADTGVDPKALPPMHLWVQDLRLGVAKLGDARLESWPTANGMHIEQLRTLSGNAQISASGDWNGDAHDSHTQMNINFSANDLGAMLGALGFNGLIHGGRTHDELDARWPGSPSNIALANMDGTLRIKVEDGRIPEAASPGVGRLLGLVSLAELPRRLTLDFGDVFGKGLAFDSISGQFRLADGNASTNDLAISGPSANITVTGRTGLRNRDYDQDVHVVPHVGNSLPLVGAVVGGPVGAAAGLAVQGLLGHGLNKAASAHYRVTGSWDKPVFTLVDRGASAQPPLAIRDGSAPPAASGGSVLPAAPASSLPAPAGSVPTAAHGVPVPSSSVPASSGSVR
ncbi:MAG: TIGR02099 family protein [Xanthomonadales bacterium]|nr:TIGR02099 family protein [Xanthomonadales bacterium]